MAKIMTTPDMRAILAANYPLVVSMARRMCRWAALDVANDAAITALRSDKYDPSRPFANWIYWHVRSAAIKHMRAKYRAEEQEVEFQPEFDRAAEPTQEMHSEIAGLCRRAGGLPAGQRAALLGLLGDMTTTEIANENGVSRQSVDQSVRRFRLALNLAA